MAQPNVWRAGSSKSSKSLLGRSIDLAAKHARTWKWRRTHPNLESEFSGSQHHLSATRPANSAAPSATKFWTCLKVPGDAIVSQSNRMLKVNMDQLTPGKPAVSEQTAAASMLSIRAVMLGDRISPSALEIGTLVSSTPIAFRIHAGLVVIFRYGVVVLIGLSPSEGTALIETLISRVIGELSSYEEESAQAQLCNDQSAEVILGGRILSQRI